MIETLRKWKPISNNPAYFKMLNHKNEENIKTEEPLTISPKDLVSIQEEATQNSTPEADFGLIAVDELSSINENVKENKSEDEYSDSTKSVLGSNQSLLLRPTR